MAEEAPGPAEETAPEQPQQQKQRGVVKVSRCVLAHLVCTILQPTAMLTSPCANAGRSGSTAIKASAF